MSTVYFTCTTAILFYYHSIKADNSFNVNINVLQGDALKNLTYYWLAAGNTRNAVVHDQENYIDR